MTQTKAYRAGWWFGRFTVLSREEIVVPYEKEWNVANFWAGFHDGRLIREMLKIGAES